MAKTDSVKNVRRICIGFGLQHCLLTSARPVTASAPSLVPWLPGASPITPWSLLRPCYLAEARSRVSHRVCRTHLPYLASCLVIYPHVQSFACVYSLIRHYKLQAMSVLCAHAIIHPCLPFTMVCEPTQIPHLMSSPCRQSRPYPLTAVLMSDFPSSPVWAQP